MEITPKELIGDVYKLKEAKINEAISFLGISDVNTLVTVGVIVTEIANYTQQDGHSIVLYKCLYPNQSGCLLEVFIPHCKFDDLFIKQG